MPIPLETLRNMGRMHRWFAISSVLLLLSLLWLIYVDYARPWREIQRGYMVAQAGLAHLDYLQTQRESEKKERDAAQQAIEAARQARDTFEAAKAQVERELAEIETTHSELMATFRSAKRRADGLRIAFQSAKSNLGDRDPLTLERQQEYEADQAEVERNRDQIALAARGWPGLAAQVEASPSRARLETHLREAINEADEAKIPFAKSDALLKVTQDEYEKLLAAHGPDHPKTKELGRKLARDVDEFTQYRLAKDEAEDRVALIKRRLKDIDSEVAAAQKRYDLLVKKETDAQTREKQYSDWLVKAVINAPLLDFTAPKGTPSREQVNQLVLPEVRQRLNYLESYTTDRCTTCHVAIDNKAFTLENLARSLEQAIPAINERRVADGATPLPMPEPPAIKDVKPSDIVGRVTKYWALLDQPTRKGYFNALLATVNRYLSDAGLKEIDLGPALWAHPDLDLFVHVDSPHPMASMGCTVCHEGNPQETDFVQAAHTPKSHKEEHDWAEKYYITSAGLPNVDFHTVQHYWDRPMLPPSYTEASCAKCHGEVADISRFEFEPVGRRINLGRELFTKVGCINCHAVEGLYEPRESGAEAMTPKPYRKVGPELTQVAAKLDRKFVEQWVYNPKKFRPSTWMPHLFLQENNRAASANALDPDPVLRTETEVSAIAHYLFTLSKKWEPLKPQEEGLKGDAERGKALFASVGCLACHANLKEYAGEWIPEHIARTEGVPKEKAEFTFKAMTYEQQAQYAIEHFPDDTDITLHPEKLTPPPDAENAYVPPIFSRVAPELSAIGSKVSKEWLYSWLKEPNHYFEKTRMPNLRLTDQEALDLAEYLSTLKHDDWQPEAFALDEKHLTQADDLIFLLLSGQRSARRSREIMSDDGGELTRMLVDGLTKSMGEEAKAQVGRLDLNGKKLLFLGSKMIAHYGCYACHKIAGFEDATPPGTELTQWAEKPVGQLDFAFYDVAFDDMRQSEEKKAIFEDIYPPDARQLIEWAHGNQKEEITHTHASFAYHKMRNPRIWDREKIKGPYDKLKMPNFYFTHEQAEALVTYLMSRKPPRVTERLLVDYDGTHAGPVAEGRHRTRELNCVGCHQIENNASTMHQYLTIKQAGRDVFDEVNAPPSLRGEGAKIQHDWLYGFLNNVEMLRPWLKVRMPSFYLTPAESEQLVAYFGALSGKDADELRTRLQAVHAYKEKAAIAAETALAQGDDGAGEGGRDGNLDPAAAGSDWFAQPTLESTAEYLANFAMERRLAKWLDFDPRTSGPSDWVDAYGKVVERLGFLQQLFDVHYPFNDTPRALVPPERFELGEKLLMELKCLQCHVLGDPNLPGSNANPSAPNLNLTFRRLRQDWVRDWVIHPAWIQPGTKMPQFFPDHKSAFLTFAPDKRAELEKLFGTDGDAQIELLLDYLYNAGIKNHTAVAPVDPGAVPGAPSSGEPEVFEEDEDEGAAKPSEPEIFVEEDEEEPKQDPEPEMEFDEP